MNKYTVIWEDRWQSGSHWHCVTKKEWVEAESIHDVMRSKYGEYARFIFEGHLCSLGEKFRMNDVIYLFPKNQDDSNISHEYHD